MPNYDFRPNDKKSLLPKPNSGAKTFSGAKLISSVFPVRGDPPSEIIRKLVLIVSVLALIGAAIVLLNFYFIRDIQMEKDIAALIELKEKYAGTEKVTIQLRDKDTGKAQDGAPVEVIGEYAEYYEKNPDFVGWVTIDPIINYPVTKGEDNVYYTKHNFDKQVTENGTVFADYRNTFDGAKVSPNTVIYGHNLITKYYFEPLVVYRHPENYDSFVKSHLNVTFDTLYERGEYKIFSAMLVNVSDHLGEVFEYWNKLSFKNKADFDNYVAECLDRSYFYTGVDLKYGDEIVTLSTCDFSMFMGNDSNMRMVVMARKVRENEDPKVDPDDFIDNSGYDSEHNIKRKMFEEFYKVYGTEWGGRNWDTNYIKDFKG
ncbi:MAG: class B sortase [Oscillospiraceae bacterium]|jgi:sortase B|nr:class B sortase [Oscillospiraceae bacterium]